MRILMFACLFLFSLSTWACDICGCASMAFGFDNLISTNRHSVGLTYGFRQFTSNNFDDYYHQAEINGRYSLNNKWQIRLKLPYLTVNRNAPESPLKSLSGPGDATLKIAYTPFYKIGGKNVQSLSLSAGTNMPSGKFVQRENDLISPNFQTGSGSWDFIAGGQYQYSNKYYVFALQGAYLLNTVNAHHYKFGDQAMAQLSAGYKLEKKKYTLMPMLSMGYEHFFKDINTRGYYQHGTGGKGLNMLAGMNIITKNWYTSLKGGTNIFTKSESGYTPALQVQLSLNYLF